MTSSEVQPLGYIKMASYTIASSCVESTECAASTLVSGSVFLTISFGFVPKILSNKSFMLVLSVLGEGFCLTVWRYVFNVTIDC